MYSLRTMKELWQISCKHKYGEITAILSNKRSNWLLLGTSRGILMLWDTRFLICLKVWTYPLKCRIWKIASCMRDPGKLVFVAGENEISLWESYFQYLLIKTETSYRQNSNGNSSIFTFLLGRRNNKEK